MSVVRGLDVRRGKFLGASCQGISKQSGSVRMHGDSRTNLAIGFLLANFDKFCPVSVWPDL